MIISQLIFKVRGMKEEQSWDFTAGKSHYRNQWCLTTDSSSLDLLRSAFAFALQGDEDTRLEHVTLVVHDDAGVEWKIEKNTLQTQVYKNNRRLTKPDAFERFLAALLDRDLASGENNLKVESYSIVGDGNSLQAFPFGQHAAENQRFNEKLQELQSELKKTVIQKLGSSIFKAKLAPEVLSQMLEPLYWSYRELSSLKSSVSKEKTEEIEYGEQADPQSLLLELSLIEEIENLYRKSMNRDTSLDGYKKHLSETQSHIDSLLESLQLDEVPSESSTPDWNDLFDVFSRIQVLEKFIRFTEQAKNSTKKRVEPIIDGFLDSITKMIEEQEVSFDEMRSLLASINLKIASGQVTRKSLEPSLPKDSAPSQKEKVEIVLNWFDRFKKDNSNGSLNTSEDEVKNEELETLAISIEYLLNKFAELQGQVDAYRLDADYGLDEFDLLQDKQLQALKVAKQKWSSLTKGFGFSSDISYENLLEVTSSFLRLQELRKQLSFYKEKIREEPDASEELLEKVHMWRQVTGSQRATELTNRNLLLSECRGIIRFKEDKKRRIRSLESSADKISSTQRMKGFIEKRAGEVRGLWSEIFEKNAISELEITDKSIEIFFRYANQKSALNKVLLSDEDSHLESVISSVSKDAISVWVWDQDEIDNTTKLSFLKTIEGSSLTSPGLYLFSDQNVEEIAHQLGMGSVKKTNTDFKLEVEESAKPKPTLSSRSTVVKKKKIGATQTKNKKVPLKPKAQEVLDILNGKTKGLRR